MLIRMYLWPLIKRFRGLFITMSLLSVVGVASVVGFGGISIAMRENYYGYLEESNTPEAFITTGYHTINEDIKAELDDVKSIDNYQLDAYVPLSCYVTNNAQSKSIQLFTFEKDQLYKPTFVETVSYANDVPNVYLETNFATENNIPCNSRLKIGYYDESIEVNVVGQIKFPDALKYGPTNQIASNNINFGRIYIEKEQLTVVVDRLLALVVGDFALEDVDIASILMELKVMLNNHKNDYGNRYSLFVKEGYTPSQALEEVSSILEKHSIKITEAFTFDETAISNFVSTNFTTFTIFGNAIGYIIFGIMILIITLFLNQILTKMMRDVGIMSAIGFKKEHIMILLATFTFLVSITGVIFGVGIGIFLEYKIDILVANLFRYPFKYFSFKPFPILMAVISTVLVNQIATFFCSLNLTRITPVQALSENANRINNNFSNRLEKFLKKAPPSTKLAVNSISRKPKKFITSFVAIFASFFMIFLSLTTKASYDVALTQSFQSCFNYETQVVLGSKIDNFEDELISLGTNDFELIKYAKVTIDTGKKSYITTLEGLKVGTDKISIPKKFFDSNPLPEEGVVINKNIAILLDIKQNDIIKIDGNEVKVAYISSIEIYTACLCNIDKIDEYANSTTDSYLINGIPKEKVINYMSNHHYDALLSFTEDTKGFFSANWKPITSVSIVFIGISVALGILIVLLMMQTTLTEQKRDICIMRSIGYPIRSISFLWSIQSISQFFLVFLFGCPVSILVSKILMYKMATAAVFLQAYITVPTILITTGLVLLFMSVCHSICMITVKHWNIADNTKNRE